MENRLVKLSQLEMGTEVSVRIGDNKFFKGKVVGKEPGLVPSYMVECLDGTFPNSEYPYSVVKQSLVHIFLLNEQVL
jgi:hypothetical protein